MGEGAKVTILPYTSGQSVILKSDTLKASSSSELVLSSGDYYTDLFDVPGTSDASSVRAIDNDAVINFYINGDFNPGNNPGINSAGNDGNFGDLPTGNFRIFINGDLNTGGGGTTFNATIYTEGDAELGSPTYIKGTLSANNSIKIDNSSKIYFSGDSSTTAYSRCPIAGDGDFCYSEQIVTGMSIGPLSMFYTTTTPINNISGEEITNVTIIKSVEGVDMSVMSEIGIDGEEKTVAEDDDEAEINRGVQFSYSDMNMGAGITEGIVYRMSDFNTDSIHTIYDGANLSIGVSTTQFNTTYTKGGITYYSEIKSCDIGTSTVYVTGPFDAWDTDSNITDRIIQTEEVSKDFSLIINSLNADNDDTEDKNGIDMEYRLYDFNTSSAVTDWASYDASSNADGEDETKLFSGITQAYRDVRVQFKFCKENSILHSLSYCQDHNIDTNTSTFSTDNFAIRPYALAAFGKNQYKRAGEDFNTTIKALTENDTDKLGNSDYSGDDKDTISGIVGYDANLSSLSIVAQYYVPTSDEIDQMQTDTGATDVATCSNAGTFTIENANDLFVNGEINTSLNFNETGILDIHISEIPTKEWAIVDSDDTADSRRYITPSTITYNKEDISANILMLFVPYKLDTTATYNNTVAGQDWLYMNDINKSNSTFTRPQHAAYISYTITAKNKDGDTTKNYTKTCFPDVDEVNCPRVNGLKLNTTFDLFLDASISSTKDVNSSFYTEDNATTAIFTLNKNITLLEGNNTIQEWISPLNFTDGVGKAKIYFNIDKKVSEPINPVVITVNDANTSTSWMANPGSPKEFNGTTLNEDKTFYYGRTHASRQIFTVNPGTDLIYYQVYCYGTGCDKSLLQNSTSLKTTDDPRWYVNSAHTALSGTVGNISVKNASTSTITSSVVEGSPAKADLTYNNDTYPYKATMLNAPSKWLIYNKYDDNATSNEFEVEFINANSNWAGKKETDNTTNKKASDRTNRRTMW